MIIPGYAAGVPAPMTSARPRARVKVNTFVICSMMKMVMGQNILI